jgi:hypothetical protein
MSGYATYRELSDWCQGFQFSSDAGELVEHQYNNMLVNCLSET